jgi:hypothetical protein
VSGVPGVFFHFVSKAAAYTVSFSALSLAALPAALPAAAGLAGHLADAGQRVGSGFLNVLTQIASPRSPAADAAKDAAGPVDQSARASADADENAVPGLTGKMQAWCDRFFHWLDQRQPTGELDIQLTLDSLDTPQLSASGQGAEQLQAALEQDPTWLQEFRELALDRVAEQGPTMPGAPPRPSPVLNLSRHAGQTAASWSG